MPLSIEIVPFQGWQSNLRLANDHLELIVTLEVGPRVISLAPLGGENVFKTYPDQLGSSGESTWQIRGGHRLWLAPEIMPFTYHLDNDPVEYEQIGSGAVRFTPPPESGTGFQKQIDIALNTEDDSVKLTHRVTNVATEARIVAPWALSVMAAGGIEVIPQPRLGFHPGMTEGDFTPNRTMVLWPFTDLTDSRWHWGRDFITLRQDAHRGPTKLGLAHQEGWVGYWLNGTLFVKSFGYDQGQEYTDSGSNFETFTNEDMLEVETLGPVRTLAPGESAEHVEVWRLYTGVPEFSPTDEGEIAKVIGAAFG